MIRRMRPRAIVTDWDETATVSDTISLVAQTAYKVKPQFSPQFDHFSKVYMDAYSAYTRRFEQVHGSRSLSNEHEFQLGMRRVELTSIDEITRLGLFSGLSGDDFRAQASQVRLRPGFTGFLARCRQLSIPVEILSINWTSLLIKECLRLEGFDDIKVTVNELEFKDNVTTGHWLPHPEIRTAIDKLEYVRSLGDDIMYIGDSGTDLLAILEARWGVVMEGTSLIKQLDKYGVKHGTIDEDKDVMVANWTELKNYMKGIE